MLFYCSIVLPGGPRAQGSQGYTLRQSIIVRGANHEYGGGLGGPGTGVCSPGGVFLVLVDVVASHLRLLRLKKTPPGPPKPPPGPPKPPPGTSPPYH